MTDTERLKLRGKLEGLLALEKWFSLQSRPFRLKHIPVLDQIRAQREATSRVLEHQEGRI